MRIMGRFFRLRVRTDWLARERSEGVPLLAADDVGTRGLFGEDEFVVLRSAQAVFATGMLDDQFSIA
jgi:hypothetical protein